MLSLVDTSPARSRREFLRVAGVTASSLALPLWHAPELQAATGSALSGKSVIFLFLQGGPPQHETFDPKVDVPSAIRSVGGDIPTTVPGLRFGESLPKLARLAHRLAIVRNYRTGTQHGGVRPIVSPALDGASIGAVFSRIAGENHPETGMPSSAHLIPHAIDPAQKSLGHQFGKFDATGELGARYAPFLPEADGSLRSALTLSLPRGRFDERRALLEKLATARREMERVSELRGLGGLQERAFDLILKGTADAFDLSKEDPRTLARYDTSHFYRPQNWTEPGGRRKNNEPWYAAHTKTLGKLLLQARRLCEAGCGFVSIHSEFVWDFHADINNVPIHQGKPLVIAPFDHAVSAFIEDCEQRGLDEKILLVCAGEMGRTPRLNKNGGRDHWPALAPLMLYGGGLTRGQVIGRSTRDGSHPDETPLEPVNLLSTIVHTLFDIDGVRDREDLPQNLKLTLAEFDGLRGVL